MHDRYCDLLAVRPPSPERPWNTRSRQLPPAGPHSSFDESRPAHL